MGLSNKKTTTEQKTQQQQSSTATTTPNVPDWLLKPYQTSADSVGVLQAQGPDSFTPQISGNLQRTYDDASALTDPDYGDARGLLSGVNYDLKGAVAADGMDRYRGLFNKDIRDPVLADYDVNAGKTRAAQAASGAANGAFRGARFGLREAATEGELARGRAATYGGLLKDAENFALAGATGDAGRLQSAQEGNRAAQFTGSGLLADITGRQASDSRANLGLRNSIAGQESALLNAIRQYPLDYQKQMQGLLAGLNPALFTGQTINSQGTSSGTTSGTVNEGASGAQMLSDAAKIAAIIAASDERVKEDIRTHHYDDKGRRWVTFRYLWTPAKRFLGVIAQEIAKTDPQAVVRGPGGILHVNYGAL